MDANGLRQEARGEGGVAKGRGLKVLDPRRKSTFLEAPLL